VRILFVRKAKVRRTRRVTERGPDSCYHRCARGGTALDLGVDLADPLSRKLAESRLFRLGAHGSVGNAGTARKQSMNGDKLCVVHF